MDGKQLDSNEDNKKIKANQNAQDGVGISNMSNDISALVTKKKSKKSFVIGLAVLLVAILAIGGYFALNKNTDVAVNNNSSESSISDQEPEEELVTTTFKNGSVFDKPLEVSVRHPKSWKVTEGDRQLLFGDKYLSPSLTITSTKNNSIAFTDTPDTGGGPCFTETSNITLKHIIKTKDNQYMFGHYVYNDTSPTYENGDVVPKGVIEPIHFINLGTDSYIERYRNADLSWFLSLTEGDTYTGSCVSASYVLGHGEYRRSQDVDDSASMANGMALKPRVNVSLSGSSPPRMTYDDIKDDPEFIKMLESLEVKE